LRAAPGRVARQSDRVGVVEQLHVLRVRLERALGEPVLVEETRGKRRQPNALRLQVARCGIGLLERALAPQCELAWKGQRLRQLDSDIAAVVGRVD